MLNIKENQNLIANLDALKYNTLIMPLIECLRFSVVMNGMTMHEIIPLVHLSHAYSTTTYNKLLEIINFIVVGHNTLISKTHFYQLLGL